MSHLVFIPSVCRSVTMPFFTISSLGNRIHHLKIERTLHNTFIGTLLLLKHKRFILVLISYNRSLLHKCFAPVLLSKGFIHFYHANHSSVIEFQSFISFVFISFCKYTVWYGNYYIYYVLNTQNQRININFYLEFSKTNYPSSLKINWIAMQSWCFCSLRKENLSSKIKLLSYEAWIDIWKDCYTGIM